MRWLVAIVTILALGVPGGLAVDKKTDTPEAAAARKVLAGKIAVDFKDARLEEALAEIKTLCNEGKLGKFSYRFDTGVSLNMTLTFKAKGVSVAEVLDGMFKKNGLGYYVISKEKDPYNGSVLIKQGNERGFPAGEEPVKTVKKETPKEKAKPKEEAKEKSPEAGDRAERAAHNKLNLIKDLLENGVKKEKVKERLGDLIKEFPRTKAAEEARKLLEKLKP